MENIKKSKRIALGLIDETRDYTTANSPDIDRDIDLAVPSTSHAKRPHEIVKYGKITFNTTAILHHYPQVSNNERNLHCSKEAKKKSDLNLDEIKPDNNNASTAEEVVVDKKKDNYNNNETVRVDITTDNAIEVVNQSVKFTEEKLV
ncbi:hypothetical protein HF086_016941 [Spodoptera exigua]|uniref:Uncharacterized protein n=1 Tax=Spodoptera exigua TaxID=7107 RepID=A0A922MHD3_SPOEX|nr:hypothetical protein HF086_016941 [Spodoptera exigua]